MPKTHYTIPFFIPFRGCPNICVFCDQNRITGQEVSEEENIPQKIEKYLSTMPASGARIEVGFFGGSFTGLPLAEQERLLEQVRPFREAGRVHGVRLSTRPDLIDGTKLDLLKGLGVSRIELGVQSMSDEVLKAAKRGHTAGDTETASGLILGSGIALGHQIMVGLPGSGMEEEIYTARRVKELGADEVRIYPVIVIRGTELADMWVMNRYKPLTLEEAIDRSARLILYFDANNVKVIRCGLHPSEGLISGEEYLAGPFHPAFGQKARERAYGDKDPNIQIPNSKQ